MINRKKISGVISLLLAVLMIFSACGTKDGGAEVGKDTPSETQPVTEPPLSKKDKLIALTFDDGPYSKTTNRILDCLEKNGGVATFFVVGYNIDDNVDTIKRAHEMGCEIANHTKDHKTLTKLSDEEVVRQIHSPNEKLQELTGEPINLFRCPGGAYKGKKDVIDMPIVLWSIDTEDWRKKDASHKGRSEEERNRDLQKIADMVFSDAEKGDIVLMHDIYDFTADLCEIVIPGLVERGFRLVTVSEMFKAYGVEPKAGEVYCDACFEEEESTGAAEPGKYIVSTSGSVLNMRKTPDMNGEVLEKIPNGTHLEVIKSENGWAYVTYNSAQGWVKSSFLKKES